jgi:hypothetical protein
MSYKGYKGIGPKKYGCNKSTNPESPAKFWGALALPALLGGGGAAATAGGGAMGLIGKLGGMIGGGGGGSKSAPEPKDDE